MRSLAAHLVQYVGKSHEQLWSQKVKDLTHKHREQNWWFPEGKGVGGLEKIG